MKVNTPNPSQKARIVPPITPSVSGTVRKRWPTSYQVGDEILIKQDQNTKFGTDPYKGPYVITEVRNNGTVRVREGIIEDTYNIRMITPYKRS